MWSTASLLLLGCPPPEGPVADAPCIDGHVCTVAGTGLNGFNGDGLPARESTLYFPTAVTMHPDGRLVVVDYNNMRIRARQDDGTLVTLAGNGEHAYSRPGAPALDTSFENPSDVAFAPDGSFYVMAQHEARVIRVGTDGLTGVYAGTGEEGWTGDDGPATEAALSEAGSLTLDDEGTLYIADTGNNCIRAVSADGTIRAIAEGLLRPQQIRWAEGALWVADADHHQVVRLDPATGELVVIAGTGEPGYAGDGGRAEDAALRTPWGVAVEGGEVWVADSGNHVIRRIGTDGVIETVAGGEDGYLDGAAPDAAFYFPVGVVAADGGLYIADYRNGAVRQLR